MIFPRGQILKSRISRPLFNIRNPEVNPLSIGQTAIGGGMVNTVNARDLHEKLGVLEDFSDWIKRARLVGGRDYVTLSVKQGRQIPEEYYLTLDAGKHIAMLSETEKGVRDPKILHLVINERRFASDESGL